VERTNAAVVGSEVARETGLATGAEFFGTHGIAEGGRCMRTRVIGWLRAGAHPIGRRSAGPDRQGECLACARGRCVDEAERRILEAEREVTAILVRYASPMGAAIVPRQINAESRLQAASPASEIARLFCRCRRRHRNDARVCMDTRRVFAAGTLCHVVHNALEERRYDIAIMRARRCQWCAGGRAAAAGGVAAGGRGASTWPGARGGPPLQWSAVWLAEARAFSLSASAIGPAMGLVVTVALAVATLAAVLPAWRAARMDVSRVLAMG